MDIGYLGAEKNTHINAVTIQVVARIRFGVSHLYLAEEQCLVKLALAV